MKLLHVGCSIVEKGIKKKIGFSPFEIKATLDTAISGTKDDN